MALFVVNRYLGENSETDNCTKNSNSYEKLLKKIEERKRLKVKESSESGGEESDETTFSPKKNYVSADNEEKLKSATVDEVNEINEHGVKDENLIFKKKKKKKRKSDNTELDINIDEEENIKGKKRKINDQDSSVTNLEDKNQNTLTKKKKIEKKKIKLNETLLVAESNEASDLNKSLEITKKRKRSSCENENNYDEIVNNHDDANVCVGSISPMEQKSEEDKNKTINSQQSDFAVIGGHNFKHKKPVKWVLPEWLSKPVIICGSLKDRSARIKHIKHLDEAVKKNLKKNKIKYFFPVQQHVIPWVLSETRCSGPGLGFWPRDICVSAPTGSGKTLSFVLPIIQRLKNRCVRRIGALVVVPVQDLAAQVAEVFRQYSIGTGLKVLSVTGKKMPLQQEQKLLVYRKAGGSYESLVDIMVTTPGRLVEHIKETSGFSLRNLKFLIIDEADRVIDNIKNDWLYHLENHLSTGGIGAVPPLSLNTLNRLPPRPQKLLFSATLTQDPEKLKQINLFQPRLFIYKALDCHETEIRPPMQTQEDLLTNQVMKPVELEELWIECSTQLKPLIFYHILVEKNWRGVLCFTHFTDATHRLTRLLHHLSTRHGLKLNIEEISSERSFNDRHRILNDFRAGKIDVLVCTDVYARGMDILEVRYVVLYSPPVHSRNYIHQVGRTARAGMKGTALTLLNPPQVKSFHRMLRSTGHSDLVELKVTVKDLSYLEKPYKKALRSLKKETLTEKESTKQLAKKTKRKNFIHHSRNIQKNLNNFKKKRLKQKIKRKNNDTENVKK